MINQMKISLLILFVSIFTFFGCKKIDELTHFDIDYNYTFKIPAFGGVNIDDLDIESPNVETNTESTFSNNDTRKDLIEGAILKKFDVAILEPADANFTFLDKIEIFVKTDDLEELLIAWEYDIPDNIGNSLKLETTARDLRKYLISNEIRVRLFTESSKPLTEDITIDLKSTIEVDAKILGI